MLKLRAFGFLMIFLYHKELIRNRIKKFFRPSLSDYKN